MKALTICQPYAHLIVRGEKLVENREWPTAYRGPLLIHAGKSRNWMDEHEEYEWRAVGDPIVFGAIVGTAMLTDCLQIGHIKRGDYDAKYPWLRGHAHTNGTWCWVLTEVCRLKYPAIWRGAQGLWNCEITAEALELCEPGSATEAPPLSEGGQVSEVSAAAPDAVVGVQQPAKGEQ